MAPLGRAQEAVAISKSGLWLPVLTSRKPEAKRFKRWLTGEVIPAIRKTGAYVAGMPGLGSLPVESMFSRKLRRSCRSVCTLSVCLLPDEL
ncbi:BRO family protein [Asaia bogorensis]|uniref:BRO-N domain-containing protein n=1 Tax=Asaia bogorensis TaxID=91915 RepID=UPI000EFA6DCD|nr:BRO family protein [Asaia bogorensis]